MDTPDEIQRKSSKSGPGFASGTLSNKELELVGCFNNHEKSSSSGNCQHDFADMV